jgi:hypothetical protein
LSPLAVLVRLRADYRIPKLAAYKLLKKAGDFLREMKISDVTQNFATQPRRFFWGLLAGLLVTAPLLAIFYLAHNTTHLPLVQFDVFDWLARVLPGQLPRHKLSLRLTIIM